MTVCNHCGMTVTDELQIYCPNCGNPLDAQEQPVQATINPAPYTQPPYQQPYPSQEDPDDKGGCLWGGLCFLFPVVGLILYLIWRKEKPKTARACGIGALVGVVLSVVFCLVGMILAAVLGATMMAGLSEFANLDFARLM